MEREQRLFGLLAHPAGHSLSPVMHNAAFKALELPYHYHAFDVPPEKLEQAVEAIKVLGIKGVNVTIPHKESIIPLLDEINPEAEAIGAVNTVVLKSDGRLAGYNTDGAGYVASLEKETKLQLAGSKVLILGAGGAAKAIGVYLLKSGCQTLLIANRTEERAEQLVRHLQRYQQSQESNPDTVYQQEIGVIPWSEVAQQLGAQFQLIINTTSVGMWPHVEQVPVNFPESLDPETVVSDIVYIPRDTLFLQQAKRCGATIHYGLGMLIYQGALAFERFTGQKAPVEVMRRAAEQHLAERA